MTAPTYDRDAALAVCQRLEDEPHLGLRQILREAGIAKSTFHDWRKQHEELEAAYKTAKEAGFDALAQQCLEIADDGSADYTIGKDGPVLDSEHIQRSKVRIDTRLKLLAKWDPKRYGDRTVLAGDPDAPLSNVTDEQLDARLNARLAKQADTSE